MNTCVLIAWLSRRKLCYYVIRQMFVYEYLKNCRSYARSKFDKKNVVEIYHHWYPCPPQCCLRQQLTRWTANCSTSHTQIYVHRRHSESDFFFFFFQKSLWRDAQRLWAKGAATSQRDCVTAGLLASYESGKNNRRANESHYTYVFPRRLRFSADAAVVRSGSRVRPTIIEPFTCTSSAAIIKGRLCGARRGRVGPNRVWRSGPWTGAKKRGVGSCFLAVWRKITQSAQKSCASPKPLYHGNVCRKTNSSVRDSVRLVARVSTRVRLFFFLFFFFFPRFLKTSLPSK